MTAWGTSTHSRYEWFRRMATHVPGVRGTGKYSLLDARQNQASQAWKKSGELVWDRRGALWNSHQSSQAERNKIGVQKRLNNICHQVATNAWQRQNPIGFSREEMGRGDLLLSVCIATLGVLGGLPSKCYAGQAPLSFHTLMHLGQTGLFRLLVVAP